MVSPSIETPPQKLIGLLEETLQALARLHAAAARRHPPEGGSSPGIPGFSQAEFDRLSRVIREGGAAVTRRLKELRPEESKSALRLAELWRSGVAAPGERSVADEPLATERARPLLATYRGTCRALCAALQAAQQISDTTTAAMLSSVLQRLEKQLWLLDSSSDRTRVGLPTINLFLSC
jgi:hypothetical protein